MGLLKRRSHLKIGLQIKSILVLSVLALAATAAGGWLYYIVARNILHSNDRNHAHGLTNSLAVAAAPALERADRETLQKLAMELLHHASVHRVCVLDLDGETMAVAERVCPNTGRLTLTCKPVSLSYEQAARGSDFLEVGRPVIVSGGGRSSDAMIGAVRLVLDTRETAHILDHLRRQTTVIGAALLLCSIPIGYVLVWRVIVLPIRRLMRATRQLAKGDFSARVETCRNDEIGELASSFDVMAEELDASHRQIRLANEFLEQKVAERTTELERANRRLHGEMTEKEEFLRAVSHDLNAPLRNIAGMATMITIKFRDKLPEEAVARLQRIQANVDAETDLITELLELSRIRTRPEKRQMVDFGRLFRSLKDSFEYELKANNITLQIGNEMPRLYVEHNRMRQVFQNLIDNAIKYMGGRADGRISIGYCRTDGMHRFSVADNGPGIAPADKDRIFQIFRRAAAAAEAGVPGKGVGLALVKSVMSNYDGHVWVESGAQAGAVFYVSVCERNVAEPDLAPDTSGDEAVCDETEYATVASNVSAGDIDSRGGDSDE